MKFILSPTHNCYYNIASEEFLLKNSEEDIFMLYINEPAVIVGKHQNAFAELNYWHVIDNNINVVRRLSGGGTVFHDLGNLNFCFIRSGKAGNLVDFRRFTQPIVDVLRQMGVPVAYSGRNDLLVHGKKFSGNAEHVYRNRTLHHGTILYASTLENLKESLKVNQNQFQDKAVRSVRSEVTNIIDYFEKPLTIDVFSEQIGFEISRQFHAAPYIFTDKETAAIQTLINEKYNRWDWNWGYSPRFSYSKEGIIEDWHVNTSLIIEKGIIIEAKIRISNDLHKNLSTVLVGAPYHHTKLIDTLSSIELPFSLENVLRAIF